jgi:phosphoenolpyruvate-protein kinase (PTS system EI component)
MKYRLSLSAEPIKDSIDDRLCGVGMIRGEYLCRHIEEYVTLPTCRSFIQSYLSQICDIYNPHEVWYRTTELVVPEINVLKGADHILEEKQYVLGMRGVRRGLKYKDTFELEIQAIAEIAQSHPNLHILLPYIYDPSELSQCIEILNKVKFPNKFGIMAEIPSTILMLDKFVEQGISNITIGTNDLTSCTLGTNRDEYHNHTHPAVMKLIEMAVSIGKSNNIPVSVGGNVSERLGNACEKLGVDYLIVHYSLLNDVLKVPNQNLPFKNLLYEIKDLTQSKIALREKRIWRDIINNEQGGHWFM